MRIGMGMGVCHGGSNDDTVLPSYAWDPRDISGAIFYLPTWNTGSMWKENMNGTPATRPSIDTDPIGVIQEPVGGFMVGVSSDAGRPLLASDSTINSSLSFASANSLQIFESTKHFRFWNSNRIGFLLCAVKFGAAGNGVLCTVIDTINNSGGAVGFNLRKDTNGQVTFQIGNGAGTLATVSSVTTVEDAAWHYVRVWMNAGTLSMKLDGGTTRTGSATAAVDGDCTNEVKIGQKANGTGPLLGSLANLVIGNATSVSDADYALWLAHNPARNSNTTALQRIYAAGNSLTVSQASHLYTDLDFSVVGSMWKLSDKSTGNVALNADKIGFIENSKSLPTGCGSFSRHALNATAAQCPSYATNVTNSLGASLFAGNTTDTSTHAGEHALQMQGTSPRGSQTHFIVYRNTTTDPGSHLLWHSNTSYLAVGGAANSTVNRRDLAVVHPASGTPLVSATNPNTGDGFGICVVRQEAGVAKIWMCNRFDLSEVGSATDWGLWTPTWIGRTGDTNWDLTGNVCQYTKYYTAHSDATIRKLVNGLATKWGISNIPTTLDNVP